MLLCHVKLVECEKYSRILHEILLVQHNIIMNLNDVMLNLSNVEDFMKLGCSTSLKLRFVEHFHIF